MSPCSTFATLLNRLDETSEIPVFLAFLHVRQVVILGFFLELEVALISLLAEVVGLDSIQNCTARLLRVSSVGKAAGEGEVVDVREVVCEPVARIK